MTSYQALWLINTTQNTSSNHPCTVLRRPIGQIFSLENITNLHFYGEVCTINHNTVQLSCSTVKIRCICRITKKISHGYLRQICSLKKDFQTCLKVTCLFLVTWGRNAQSKKDFQTCFKSNMFIHGYLGQKCHSKKDFQICLKVTCLFMVTWDRNAHPQKKISKHV